jgi:large subunit ribosomal protein L21
MPTSTRRGISAIELIGCDAECAGRTGTVYAVVETGGKQYRVSVGQVIDVELLDAEAGSAIELDRVLMVGGEGADLRIGAPIIEGARVLANVSKHHRGEKLIIFKMKAKKRYRRRTGHRQELTRLQITDILV